MNRILTTGKFRVPAQTKSLLQKLRTMHDLQSACELVIDLTENHYRYECEEADSFDPKTGEPLSFKWRPGIEFQYDGRFGNIYLGGANCANPGEDDIRLHSDVEKILISAPTFVDCATGKYAFVYSERDNSGMEQGGGTFYATRRQIDVYKLKATK